MKKLEQLINSRASQDGDGVKIQRIAGPSINALLDPFLMIDEIKSDQAADYIGGFPEHPHRGFETITYMKVGKMRHKDHLGNEGVISAGGVQWMTAGAGVLHSEMPEQDDGLLHGFQIWLNLPSQYKLVPASYRDIPSADITEHQHANGALLRVISGEVKVGATLLAGAAPKSPTHPMLLDLQLPPNQSIELEFGRDDKTLVYVYEGASGGIKKQQMGIYSSGESLHIQASVTGLKALILSGNAINEAIVQYGPFVMNTAEEIEQAFKDLRDGSFVVEKS